MVIQKNSQGKHLSRIHESIQQTPRKVTCRFLRGTDRVRVSEKCRRRLSSSDTFVCRLVFRRSEAATPMDGRRAGLERLGGRNHPRDGKRVGQTCKELIELGPGL